MYVALKTVRNVVDKIAGNVVVDQTIVVGPQLGITQMFVDSITEWPHVV